MCVSLDEAELVDSVLTFLSGYDTLEYSWVKAIAVSVRLRILFVTLQCTNKEQGTWVMNEKRIGECDDDESARVHRIYFSIPNHCNKEEWC